LHCVVLALMVDAFVARQLPSAGAQSLTVALRPTCGLGAIPPGGRAPPAAVSFLYFESLCVSAWPLELLRSRLSLVLTPGVYS